MSTEAEIQQQIRLEAARRGTPLWRNNNGASLDQNGRMIRFGLGNDSSKLGKVWKSSDLIGIYPVTINEGHIGMTFGLFYAVEVKRPGFVMDDRARAQAAFGETVTKHGGVFRFATGVGDLP